MYRSTKIFRVFDGARFENHKTVWLTAFVFLSFHRNGLCVLFSRPTAKPHERCAQPRGTRGAHHKGARCQAAHRAKARRRDGDIAPYRNGTAQWNRTTGHGQRPGGRSSHPTATGRGRGAQPRDDAAQWSSRGRPARHKKTGRSIHDSPGRNKIGWQSVNQTEDGLHLFSQAVLLLWQEERPATDGTARDSRRRLPQGYCLQ